MPEFLFHYSVMPHMLETEKVERVWQTMGKSLLRQKKIGAGEWMIGVEGSWQTSDRDIVGSTNKTIAAGSLALLFAAFFNIKKREDSQFDS